MHSFARRNARISSATLNIGGIAPSSLPLLDTKTRPIIQKTSRKLANQRPLRSKRLLLEDEPGLYEEDEKESDDWQLISRSRELFPTTDKLVYPSINEQLFEAGQRIVATNPAVRSALEDVFMQMQREGSLPQSAMESLSIHTGEGALLIPAPIAGRNEGETESTGTGPSLLLQEAQPREPVERKRVTKRSKRALARAGSVVTPGVFMRALNWILSVLNKIPEHLHPMTTAFRSRVSSPRLLEEPRAEPRQDGMASDNDETASQPGAPRSRAVVPISAAPPPASRPIFTPFRIAVAATAVVALRSVIPNLVSRVSAAWQGATTSAPAPVAGPSLSTSLYN